MDYMENILQLTITVVMQVLCLFQYIKYKKRGQVYLIAFFLCTLVSSYSSVGTGSGGRRARSSPCAALAAMLVSCFEFGMWIASCFDWPSDYLNPYYCFSILCSLDYMFLGWAVNRTYAEEKVPQPSESVLRHQRHLRVAYLAVVMICCLGGLVLGMWMRDMLIAGTRGLSGTNVFDIIPVILFVCSMIIVAFAVAIIKLVSYSQKAAESDALREAKAIAEQSNASKSEFLANMSHEIRTPINAVLGMNEMVLRESMQARDDLPQDRDAIREAFVDICRYSANIESAGNSLLAIINDILDFSRIESGKLEITEANYELSSVLNDVTNMIYFKARDKGLDFSVKVDEGIPNGLCGDEVRIRQVIINLLSNAVKYTDSGSVHMDVRGEAGPGDDIMLTVSVRDTGIGIRQEDVERLFTKFQRVDLTHNSTVEGTGLGLAITRSLLDRMGGEISVESVYRQGSTFTVKLPQRVVSREPVGNFQMRFEKNLQGARACHARFRAPQARILVVDDTRMNIEVAVGLMKKTAMQIDTALSGAEAVELARSTRYDLILMDQRMPGMDGTEALRRIRADADGANADTPVACLTADAVNGAKERYIAEGFTDYLTKPIDCHALETLLLRYIPGDKVERAVEEARQGSAAPGRVGEALPSFCDQLEVAGVDAREGFYYCQSDEALYRSLLADYARSAEQKARDLQRYLDEKDWKNYNILVHALKSTSRTIGAKRLSELAAWAEAASGAGDGDGVRQAHGELMELLDRTAGAIRRLEPGDALAEQPQQCETGIFEFPPEA